MCLDVESEDEQIENGTRKARKTHRCRECNREIGPGETYRYWKVRDAYDETLRTDKMCAHCYATVDLGAAITGCPKCWYWDSIHDLDPDEGGFVGDILANHALSAADRARMLKRVAQRKRGWRQPNGELYPLPTIPVVA